MKTTLLSSFFCLMTVFLMAQPTITSAYFVAANDILETRIDTQPSSAILPLGTNQQTWDYSSLSYAASTLRDSFFETNMGPNNDLYPDAELVQINGSIEQYYNVTSDKQELVGYAGQDPVGLGIFVNARYDQPSLYRSAPLALFSQINSTSSVSFAVDAAQLPDSLLNQLPITPDSIRVAIANTKNGIADAYGDMTIPGGTYTVLRLNLTEYTDTKIFAKLGNFWLDITSTVISSIPNIQGIGKDTIKHFDFITNTEKEIIASVYVDNNTDEVQRVVYKANVISSLSDINAPRPSLSAYPNPVENEVMFRLDNIPSGKYTIKIYNILGATVWQKPYRIDANTRLIWENLRDLNKGTYLLSLVNENNITLSTQRLVVIRP